jgi:hypothetical protein
MDVLLFLLMELDPARRHRLAVRAVGREEFEKETLRARRGQHSVFVDKQSKNVVVPKINWAVPLSQVLIEGWKVVSVGHRSHASE